MTPRWQMEAYRRRGIEGIRVVLSECRKGRRCCGVRDACLAGVEAVERPGSCHGSRFPAAHVVPGEDVVLDIRVVRLTRYARLEGVGINRSGELEGAERGLAREPPEDEERITEETRFAPVVDECADAVFLEVGFEILEISL